MNNIDLTMNNINLEGYFLATKNDLGLPDKPFGSVIVEGSEEDEAIAVFTSLERAAATKDLLVKDGAEEILHIFKVNMRLIGETIV